MTLIPYSSFLHAVSRELARAQEQYPPMRSAHEALAILQEEVFELQQEVYQKQSHHNHLRMKRELVQIAAMAARFAEDICDQVMDED